MLVLKDPFGVLVIACILHFFEIKHSVCRDPLHHKGFANNEELSPVKVERLFWAQRFRFCHAAPGVAIGLSYRFGIGEVVSWRSVHCRCKVVEVEPTF